MKPIFFSYLSRSGSTIIAKYLNDYEDIAVTPELSTYRFVNETITSFQMAENFITILQTDDRFDSWNIDIPKFKKKLSTLQYPIKFDVFHNLFLEEFRQRIKPEAKFVLNKTSVIGSYHNIKKLYPDAVFIFIIRDIRAITNSLLNTYDPYYDSRMIRDSNSIILSLAYKRLINLARKNKDNIIIKYEDFIENPISVLQKIEKRLNISNTKSKSNLYRDNLSEIQKQIHQNLDKPVDNKRINAWREELDKTYIFLFQKLTAPVLKKYNYPLEKVQLREINKKIMCAELVNFIFTKKAGLGFFVKTALKKY